MDQSSASTIAATSTPALPDSVRRNVRTGAAARRVSGVRVDESVMAPSSLSRGAPAVRAPMPDRLSVRPQRPVRP
ncbi:hypothetical protein [Fodinicola feengrottensis]|uniref:hypothetical protein n=1 Tax=Fodinicola feengrottensis TaxID=435914 RepID=UPI0024420D69|nr:hypothetical protein [Fodinicola feengrottensis]